MSTPDGKDIMCRVASGTSALDKYDLVYFTDDVPPHPEIDIMPASESANEWQKAAGFCQIAYPAPTQVYDPQDVLRPVTDVTVTSEPGTVGDVTFGGLKGGVTVKTRGQTWGVIKVSAGGTAVTIDPADFVIPSNEDAGGIINYGAFTQTDALKDRTIVGRAISDVYETPSMEGTQWASNQVTVPGSGTNYGYVLLEVMAS